MEIACDESGSEGGKLVGGTTDVLAHASVVVDADLAAAWLDEVRVRARSPATEVKASVVLREQNRAVLRDLLGRDGPFWADEVPAGRWRLLLEVPGPAVPPPWRPEPLRVWEAKEGADAR